VKASEVARIGAINFQTIHHTRQPNRCCVLDLRIQTVLAKCWAVRLLIRLYGQILLPQYLMNGSSSLDETYREYSLAPTDELVRCWRSKVKVTGGRRNVKAPAPGRQSPFFVCLFCYNTFRFTDTFGFVVLGFFLPAQRYASAVLAVIVCPSVRLSHASIVAKQLKVGSRKQCHVIA